MRTLDSMINILNEFDHNYIDENEYDYSDLGETVEDDTIYIKSKRRATRRKTDKAKAKRKQRIASKIYNGYPYYSNLHQYSKNKIHCSCWRCAFNFPTNKKSYTHSDLMRIEKLKYDEKEYTNKPTLNTI